MHSVQLALVACAVLFVVACGDDDGQQNDNNDNGNNANTNGYCGDGHLNGGEQCDEGTANSDNEPNACRSDCRNPHCGDGVQDNGEACDDGNTIQTDDCLDTCDLNVCGDGHVNETMDGTQPKEQCDDGNASSGDGCRGDCQQDETLCGDGNPDPGEECDEGNSNSDTVANRCRMGCTLPTCGDNVADTDYGEQCDQGAVNSNTDPDVCREDCQSFGCGDGVKDSNEECDTADFGGMDCTDYNFAAAAGLTCDTQCDIVASGCTASCGNGVREPGESCDNGGGSGDGCDATCHLEPGWTCAGGYGDASVCSCISYHQGAQCEQCVVYVDIDNVSGTEDGTSWATAHTSIQSAFVLAASVHQGSGCQVWVAEGTYYHHASGGLLLDEDDIELYGGFAGTESVRDDRDPVAHPTVLSGADGPSPTAYTAPVVAAEGDNLVLSGFHIRDGINGAVNGACLRVRNSSSLVVERSTFAGCSSNKGGAIFVNTSSGVVLRRLVVHSNEAGLTGGGLHLDSAYVTLENSLIYDNLSFGVGGIGLHVTGNGAKTVRNCTIVGNVGSGGAAVVVQGPTDFTLENSIVTLNASDGSYYLDGSTGTVTCTDSIIMDAASGSCVDQDPVFVHAPLTFRTEVGINSYDTFASYVGDYVVGDPVEIARDGVVRTVTSAVGGANSDVTFSPVLTYLPFGPLPVANWHGRSTTTLEYDCHLDDASSPGVDTANSNAPAEDLELQTRVNGDGANGAEPDMGCYEYVP